MKIKCKRSLVCSILTVSLIISMIIPSTIPTYAATTVNINWNDIKQEIDGFGVSAAAYAGYWKDMPEPERTEILDLLFSNEKGIGLTIFRSEIYGHILSEDGTWNFSSDEAQAWAMKEAKKRGVDKLIGTVWSPPAWMKTNNSIIGGSLKEECFQQYADFLAGYIKGYKELHDLDMYAVSIANEPVFPAKWQSCCWKSSEIRDFLKNNLKPSFERENITSKVIAAEDSNWSDFLVRKALDDTDACSRLDIVGAHQYQGIIRPLSRAKEKGKRVWMTELSDPQKSFLTDMNDGLFWANVIHKFLAKADVNAFLYWLGVYNADKGEGLIRIDLENGTYETSKKLYVLGNYSRFIKPGYVRIGITENPISDVKLSAYKDEETGDFTIVAINESDTNHVINITLSEFNAGKITPYVTNADVNLQKYDDIQLSNGNFTVSLGAGSVTTLVGTQGSEPSPVKQWSMVDKLDDWSKIDSRSDNWTLDNDTCKGNFEQDYSRATRTNSESGYIIYHNNNIKDFLGNIYYRDNSLDEISFFTSPDNVTWTPLDVIHTPSFATSAEWYQTKFSPLDDIIDGTNYLKVEFTGNGNVWNKQLAQINILSNEQPAIITDTYDDWSKVYEKSSNIAFDTTNNDNFEQDESRACRTTSTSEFLTYKLDGEDNHITDFTLKAYYFIDFPCIKFFGSSNNVDWSEISTEHTSPVSTQNKWNRTLYSPIDDITDDTKYLKIEIYGGGPHPWDRQLSELNIYSNGK
ncbi:hypothetical protein SH1V18_24560 [Vallitalea longa]|uniref:Glycosyl hydrolase family 59 catalytic domain-containing protein n=1 Tax=Vallitalea longa TaxID=2936439 RepID=A0A9W5YC69_9FIRM|nr:glycoside hydrolase [Vallitalea longa]GKX29976.1 hypothetical protein SH1V18_24560 [Vallitalea longa]